MRDGPLPAELLSRAHRSPAAVLLAAGSALVTAGIVLTQLLAHRLRFDPALGPPLLAADAARPLRAAALGCALIAVALALLRRRSRWAALPLAPLALALAASLLGPLYPPQRGLEWSLVLLGSPSHREALAFSWAVAAGLLALCAAGGVAVRRAPSTAVRWVHGSARLADRADLRAAGMLGASRGILLGRWPPSRRGALLRDDSEHHVLVTIPPGGGKTTGPILGTLLTDADSSAFVVDPKAELWSLSAGWRARQGQRCLRFSPSTGEGLRWNVLDEIDPGPGEIRLISALGEALLPSSRTPGPDDHWINSARTLFRALVLHALYAQPGASMATVLALLHDPSPEGGIGRLFAEMLSAAHDPELLRGWRHRRTGRPTPTHPEVARVGRAMIDTPERERGSIVSTLAAALALWGDEVVAGATARSDFSLRDLALRAEPVTLYVTLPYPDLERLGPLVRMMLGVLTLRVTEAPPAGRGAGRRLLLLLDEFRALGRVLILEQMLAYLRGYGVRAAVVVQELAQIRQVYTDRESITGNCQLQVFAATQNLTTRQHASRLAGEATVRYRRRSVTSPLARGRQSTVSDADARRPLLTEGEIGTLPPDHLLIFKAGLPPILAGKLPYYDHPELARRAALPAPSPVPPPPAVPTDRPSPPAAGLPPIPVPAQEPRA